MTSWTWGHGDGQKGGPAAGQGNGDHGNGSWNGWGATGWSGNSGSTGGNGGTSHHPGNPQRQSALDMLKKQLNQWGLSSLYNAAIGYLHQGIAQNPQELQLELENTKEWKTRFAGNELRKQNGLAELTPSQYLSLEASYRGVLQKYGLPSGFFDQHSDFVNFIGGDISPAELDTRAKIAHDQYMNAPPEMKSLWQQYYGTKGDAIAGILSPKIATQVIQDRANAVGIGGAAAQHGLTDGRDRAEQLGQYGVTQQQAQQGYAQISVALPTDSQIAQRFGTTFDQQQEENAVLLGQSDAVNKQRRLYSQEQGLFSERASHDASSLGVSQSY